MTYSYYSAYLQKFQSDSQDEILGALARGTTYELDALQRTAWLQEISVLKTHLSNLTDGWIGLEFSIPRMGKRADAVLVYKGIVFVLEFKVGESTYPSHAIDQVIDYALDLKCFHNGSFDKPIIPILIATEAPLKVVEAQLGDDLVSSVIFANKSNLGDVIGRICDQLAQSSHFDAEQWATSGYKPTPTIIEAAQALYTQHQVGEITRSDAGAQNLTVTSNCLAEIIEFSKSHKKKSICFVTGVPGAGKTLVGLNLATNRKSHTDEHAVFLSGNGPLVDVLREALARDQVARSKNSGEKISKSDADRQVKSFIQNIHHFRDDGMNSSEAPIEKVIIFDEAQRAWDQRKTANFMKQNKGRPNFEMSEPEFLISVMDRHPDWCTIICLIGGGQEINDGEAGLSEWLIAISRRFPAWNVFVSPQLTHKDYDWGVDLGSLIKNTSHTIEPRLHLSVSIRSFRAEKLADFVNSLIDGNIEQAKESYQIIKNNYPIKLTRDLNEAKAWLRTQARGSQRSGLVASSGALRLKPEGLNVKAKIEACNWFLNDKYDVRSSYYLEDVATEYDIQGLELDWVSVCWDADFRWQGQKWSHHAFRGTTWQDINSEKNKKYLENTYRVLLTRARQGMVIFIPLGSEDDSTRAQKYYDQTFSYFDNILNS